MMVFCKYCMREMVPHGKDTDYSAGPDIHWYVCINANCAVYKVVRPLNLRDMIVYS